MTMPTSDRDLDAAEIKRLRGEVAALSEKAWEPTRVVSDEYGRVRAENERLRTACELALDFHSVTTQAFIARYGHLFTTRELCDRLCGALQAATRPAAEAEA